MSGVVECCEVCQKVVRCVRRSSGVSEYCQVCQKVVRCVRRSSGVSEGRQVCQKVIRCLSRSSIRLLYKEAAADVLSGVHISER